MAELAKSVSLNLKQAHLWESLPLPVDPLTAEFRVCLSRPTTVAPRRWAKDVEVRVSIHYRIDGMEYFCIGGAMGGVKMRRNGEEWDTYTLSYHPAELVHEGTIKRIGETAKQETVAWCRVEALNGDVDTDVTFTAEAWPIVDKPIHHSVAYNTSIDGGQSGSGGATLTVNLTATGSDRAAFVGTANSDAGGGLLGSCTYAGNALTELWDRTVGSFYADGGYRAIDAEMGSGAQNVISTLTAGNQDEHYMTVITFEGVDQTTPVAGTNQASGSSNAPSVATTGAASGDMVVDSCWQDGSGTLTEGADQTPRQSHSIGTMRYASSTQPGASGNTMSWSSTASDNWGIGATVMKQGAAATGWGQLFGMKRNRLMAVVN